MWLIATWEIGQYHFTCEVEYWPSDGSKARSYWNYGTDKKFGGPGKSGYFIEIKMVPLEYWLSKKIHGWIRQVRPFKGPFGPGDIDQFWQTGITGQENEILYEVKTCLRSEFDDIPYEKIRTKTRDFLAEEKTKQEKIDAIKEAEADKRWLAGAPARAAKAAADRQAAAAYAAEAVKRKAARKIAEAAAAKEKARQYSFTTARYAKQAKAGSWWNSLSENERIKCIASESGSYYEKVLDGDLGAIPKPTQNFDEIFASAQDIVVDWYMGRDAKSSPTKRRRWFR